ncbi:MAG: hypothetical protein PHZ00_00100 [Candidatus Peribacteraceae bacterium]|nr:hypothetical protein [Candidatus Peribacteraceae bacterium]
MSSDLPAPAESRETLHKRLPDAAWMILESLPAICVMWVIGSAFITAPFFFDSKTISDCSRVAAEHPWSLTSFTCSGHPSLFLTGLLSIPELLLPGNVAAMHAVLLTMAAMSLIALSSILRLMVPAKEAVLLRIGSLLLLGTHPVFLGNLIGFNTDLGVMLMFPIFLALLLRRHWIPATLAALCLAFTKETGFVLYGITVLLFVLLSQENPGITKEMILSTVRRYWFLLLPLAAYVICAILLILLYDVAPVHLESGMFAEPSLRRTAILVSDILLFQFQWIQTSVILIASVLLLRAERSRSLHDAPLMRMLTFFGLIYLIGIMLLIFRVPYNNVRYVMPLVPVGILLFAGCLHLIRWNRWFNGGLLLSAIFILQLSALTRSNDPVSRFLYGTFPFGEHRFYSMGPAAEDPCCGQGRDQLVYNLQHQKLRTVTELAIRTLQPNGASVLVAHRNMFIDKPDKYWGSFPSGVDPVTFRFTEDPQALHPVFINPESLLRSPTLPDEVHFFEFPNLDNREAKELLLTRFEVDDTFSIEEGGYAMTVVRMRQRSK